MQKSNILYALLTQQGACRRCNLAIQVIQHNDAALYIHMLQNLVAEWVDRPGQQPRWVWHSCMEDGALSWSQLESIRVQTQEKHKCTQNVRGAIEWYQQMSE